MPFKKGQSGNPEGRAKNSSNKTTTDMRETLQKIVDGELGSVKDALNKLKDSDPDKYLALLDKYITYVLPKKKDITSDDQSIVPHVTIVERRDQSKPEAD